MCLKNGFRLSAETKKGQTDRKLFPNKLKTVNVSVSRIIKSSAVDSHVATPRNLNCDRLPKDAI